MKFFQQLSLLLLIFALSFHSGVGYSAQGLEKNTNPNLNKQAIFWTLRYQYEPDGTNIFGNSEILMKYGLIRANILTCKNNQYFSSEQCLNIVKHDARLQKTADINRDGKQEIWNVGVGISDNDESVTFLVVRDLQSEQILDIKLYKGAPGERYPNFTVLKKGYGGDTYWSHCYACDPGNKIIWDGKSISTKWIGNF